MLGLAALIVAFAAARRRPPSAPRRSRPSFRICTHCESHRARSRLRKGRGLGWRRGEASACASPRRSERVPILNRCSRRSSIACVCGASLETPARSRRAGVRTYRPCLRMLGAPRSEPFVNLTRASTFGAIMIFQSYKVALEYTPTQAKRLVVAPTVRSMFGCVSGSAIAPPHQLESHSPCPLPAFVAAAAALTSASVNQ